MELLKTFSEISFNIVPSLEKGNFGSITNLNNNLTAWAKAEKIKSYRIVNATLTPIPKSESYLYTTFVAYIV
jgi:hypothetical protein